MVFPVSISIDSCNTSGRIILKGAEDASAPASTASSWPLLASSFNGQEFLSALAGSSRSGFLYGNTMSSLSLRATTRYAGLFQALLTTARPMG